tara:strand:+ start:9265 stop:10470 length:1206 start_codon:yes stop_codon:yes gene_type:complete
MPESDSESSLTLFEQIQQNTSKLPSQNQLFFFFTVLTIVYGIIVIGKIIMIGSSGDCNLYEINNDTKGNIYTIIYILLLLGGSYYINNNIAQQICENNAAKEDEFEVSRLKIFGITFLPWLIIFGVIYLLLELFPGWIKPFSNTLGYLVINLLGIEQIYKKEVIKNESDDFGDDSSKNIILNAIMKMNDNYHTTINQFSSDINKYKKFVDQLKVAGIVKGNEDSNSDASNYFCKFYSLICVKEVVGKLLWYVLSGSLISAISYNFIMNLECRNQNINDKITKLDEKNNKKTYYGISWQYSGTVDPSTSTSTPSSTIEYNNIVLHPRKSDIYSQFIAKYRDRFVDVINNHRLSENQLSNNEKIFAEFTRQELKLGGIYDKFKEGAYIAIMIDNTYYYFVVNV